MKNENVYLVGGAVRDILLGIDPKDKDYVVVGSSEKEMESLGFEQVGKDFPVFLHPETKFEYALARKEKKSGTGYNGFEVETENVSLSDDLFRRDLTINSMAMDCYGNLIDPFNGKTDLDNKVLRHVSKHFAEDPVRILRIARFSARYNFTIADETIVMMRTMVNNGEFDSLTAERVWKEFEKVLSEPYLINFFNVLEKIGALKKIPGFDKIENKEYFEYIKSNNENCFDSNLIHIFSQLDKKSFNYWKIPSEEMDKINGFINWKENNNLYSNMLPEERLKFIISNRAIQNTEKANFIITQVLQYRDWVNNTKTDAFLHVLDLANDISKIKKIDYPSVLEEAKNLKIKVNELVYNYQLNSISKNKNKNKIN